MSRSVLITGGNRGIGHAAVRAFIRRGDRVAFTHYTECADFDLVHDGALPVYCDVTDPEQVETAFSEVEADQGLVEVLVVDAGNTWANLATSYRLANRAARGMRKAGRGRIVLVFSAVAPKGEAETHNGASTAALVDFGRSLASEIGVNAITVTVVTEGPTGTAMAGDVPLGPIGNPEEVASAIALLAGEEAAVDTSVLVSVDGDISVGA